MSASTAKKRRTPLGSGLGLAKEIIRQLKHLKEILARTPKEFAAVEITWIDSQTIDGWESLSHVTPKGPLDCCSVGFVIGLTSDSLLLAQSRELYAPVEQVNGQLKIPLVAIKNIFFLYTAMPDPPPEH